MHRGGITFSGNDLSQYLKYGHDSSCFLSMSPIDALEKGYISKKDYKGGKGYIGWKASEIITKVICHRIHKELPNDAMPEIGYTDRIDSSYISELVKKPTLKLPDSTLIKVFKRHNWRKMAIVDDVTGSMYPYTAQLLIWLKLQSLDSLTNNYTFFNDGDNLPDRKKKIGKTGGIYSKKCNGFGEVFDLVKSTMVKGGGGDCPENNIEALIQSENEFEEIDFHVLIADNWAPIKDFKLAATLKKPVRIVLCGVYNDNVNLDYLNLARITKGSVHLIEQDIDQLATMHEGETITIGERQYKLVNGRFKDVDTIVNKKI